MKRRHLSDNEHNYRYWRVQIKEINNDIIINTSIQGDYNYDDVIDFFALQDSDVEWFNIEEEIDNK